MEIEKIEIEIDGSDGFAEAAFCIDQPGLAQDIHDLREKWKLQELIKYDHFDEWLQKSNKDLELGSYATKLVLEARDRVERAKNKGTDLWYREEELNKIDPIEFSLDVVLEKCGLSPEYKGMLLRAVVCGVVRAPDLHSNDRYQFRPYPVSGELVDVDSSTKGYFNLYEETFKRELKRDRRLYLRHKAGVTLRVLAEENVISVEGVKVAISRYRKFLEGYK